MERAAHRAGAALVPFTTYDELRTAISSWALRSDLLGVIPDFIRLAESRMNKELRVRDMISQATGSLTTSESTLAQPSGFLQVLTFQVTSNPVVVLEYRPHGSALAVDSATVGGPRVFTIVGGNFEIYPPPDSSYAYVLDYYASLPPLATANTNWLLVKAPDLYLYASLMELWVYLQDDEQLARYTAAYESAREKLIASDGRTGISTYPLIARVA